MIGLDQASAKMELIRRGCSWEWFENNPVLIGETPNNGIPNAALLTSSKASVPLDCAVVQLSTDPTELLDNPKESHPVKGALEPMPVVSGAT